MINPDILRVMAELHTFTSEDLASALECPVGTTGGLLPRWVREGYVVRFKFRKTYLYALSDRGERLAAKLPPVDPDERCLLIESVEPADICEGHATEVLVLSSVVGMINHGATRVIRDTVFCKLCGEIISQAEYTETPW